MNAAQLMIERDRDLPTRIMVVGDGMTDVYLHGEMEDTCQEGCPKFVIRSSKTVPGGAANAARSLQHWRATLDYLGTPRGCGPKKTRLMVGDRCVFRYDDDAIKFDAALVRLAVLERLWSQKPPRAVLLSDYDKGLLSPQFIASVVDACRHHGIPCVADCKRSPDVYRGCILKGNVYYHNLFHVSGANTVITVGSTPPTVWDHGEVQDVSAMFKLRVVNCVNHVGAGDCFAAHLTLALAYGFSLKEAAAVAHSAGRVYVQRPHNTPPSPDEVAADMALSD